MQTSAAIATAERADKLAQFVLCALELLGEAGDLVRAATMTLPGEPLSGRSTPAP